MRFLKYFNLLFLGFLFIFPCWSAEKAGIQLPDTVKVHNKELILNGVGIRRGTFLNVKVYVGGLYLPSKSSDPQEILNMPYPKYISMTFLRDVPESELKGAWKEGFEAAVSVEKRKTLQKFFDQFNALMGEVKKKETILINFLKKGIEVTLNGKTHKAIGNQDFSRAILSVWFINARDERLRDELLGKN